MDVCNLMYKPNHANLMTLHTSTAHDLKLPMLQIALLSSGKPSEAVNLRFVTVALFWACCIVLGIVVCRSNIREQALLSPHTL